MFRTYRQANTAGQYQFSLMFKNTFAATNSMVLQILWIGTVGASDSTIELISALEEIARFLSKLDI
jgi:hypothetical protein